MPCCSLAFLQAAVELAKQLQQRIKQRGCKEEFVPNAEMLEEGKVGAWAWDGGRRCSLMCA